MAEIIQRNYFEAKLRRELAIRRFKKIIRKVVINMLWLQKMEEKRMNFSTKRNLENVVRKQVQVGVLTLSERTLFVTEPENRTVEDRKKLVSLMVKLRCFAKLSPKIRARLVPIVQFLCFPPSRVLMREGTRPMTVYFILTGEVELSKRVYDRVKKCYMNYVYHVSAPGDCVGWIDMVNNTMRTDTFVAVSYVELLAVDRDDFDRILRTAMTQQSIDKRKSLEALGYFDHLTADQLQRALRIGDLQEYQPLDTIYAEDRGLATNVNFVLSGECMILQALKIKVSIRGSKKSYELLNFEKDEHVMFTDERTNAPLVQIDENPFQAELDVLSEDEEQERLRMRSRPRVSSRKIDMHEFEIACGLREPDVTEKSLSDHDDSLEKNWLNEGDEYGQPVKSESSYDDGNQSYHISPVSSGQLFKEQSLKEMRSTDKIKNETSHVGISSAQATQNPSEGSLLSKKQSLSVRYAPMLPQTEDAQIVTRTENHFIDVGSISFCGIFGLGEEMEHRVIMARTKVQCLSIPRYWLFSEEHNPGNIWNRRRFYLESNIPSRQKLFEDFILTRKWQKFKRNLIERKTKGVRLLGSTKPEDIPIICHILESSNDDI